MHIHYDKKRKFYYVKHYTAAGTVRRTKLEGVSTDEEAKAMVDAIEQNKPRLCIGSDAKLMDKLSRLNPVFAANLIYKQMAALLK